MANNNEPQFPALLESEPVKKRFLEVLDKNSTAFRSTLLAIWNGSQKLQECTPKSILGAAGLAATLNLSIAPSLGYAYIVPYKNQAQFQIGAKGLVQLAHRTKQYTALHSGVVREGEIRGTDVITGDLIKGELISDKVVGYVAYMGMVNGFSKALYMTKEQMQEHAEKYSSSYSYDLKYGKKSSVWSTNFDAMAKKTVLKLLLTHWGFLSADMAKAIQCDQAVVSKDWLGYIDNGGRTVPRDDYSQLDDVDPDFVIREEIEAMSEVIEPNTGEVCTRE